MADSALIALLISIFVFTTVLFVVGKERRRGRRFFATRIRGKLDKLIQKAGAQLLNSWKHFSKYVIQLNWYYSIHSVLRTILRVIIAFYTYFENIFERNRNRTKQLRVEKRQLSEFNHLRQMTTHRQDTALSAAQQKKLKQKKLDEKN
jgi:hypothetical protein